MNTIKTDAHAAPAAVCCCACGAGGAGLVETHHDRRLNILYRLYACPRCELVFAEPREAVPARWYEEAVPLEAARDPEKDPRYASFLALEAPRGALLDIGCGDGDFLALAARRGFRCVGFDYDPRKAERARARGLEVHAREWASFCASRREGEFSVVTLFDVLEHVCDPRGLVREARRLLESGGELVVTLPNALRPLPFGREDFDFPPHHLTRWTPRALRGLLEREGFSQVRQQALELAWGDSLRGVVTPCAVKPALGLAKRLLFGRGAPQEATLTELSGEGLRGPLADKGLRRRLFGLFEAGASLLLAPLAAALRLYSRAARRGGCLFTAARKS